jgi:hypothetical protein
VNKAIPLLHEEGGRDIKKNAAKPPLLERTGWLRMAQRFVSLDHPVCAKEASRNFLEPQPPLLVEEGNGCVPGGDNTLCKRKKY